MDEPSEDHTGLAMTCHCGRMRLPGSEHCGIHGADWDDETAEALERIAERDRKRQAARALADLFVANADSGDNEANTAMVTEMRRRMQQQGQS